MARPPPVDRLVWLACAAPLSRLPVVGSQVYYFPDGHAEQCPTPLPDPLPPAHQVFLCTVTAVHLAADTSTGEPYATISLVPVRRHDLPPAAEQGDPNAVPPAAPAPGGQQQREFCYYAKQLTQSDANNGGGFSVPRFCADHIFPPLDFDDDPPVQTLIMRDLQGKPWEFRHIYRGTPRRHLLTTGWSKFVNAKVLVAGDTVVFMCFPDGKLLVAVRRVPRYGGDSPCDARARVPAREVMEAVRLAADDAPFTVTYYPRQGAGEFVVPRMDVEEGFTDDGFRPGIQVRTQIMETEDTRRIAWLNGTLKKVYQRMWRKLEVEWDASVASSSKKNIYVNPWQVQRVKFPPLPRGLKISDSSTSSPMCTGDPLLVPPMLPPSSQLPAGIQGARHDNPNAHADMPSSSTSMLRTQPLFPRDLQISVPPSLGGGSSGIVNPQDRSPSSNSVNTPPSDVSDGMKTIRLFGVTITSPVQSDTNGAFFSAQLNQVPEGMDDETASQEASATSPLDPLTNGHNNQDGARL